MNPAIIPPSLIVVAASIVWHLAFYLICFVALRPKSTAMVIAERSVHLTTHFPGQA